MVILIAVIYMLPEKTTHVEARSDPEELTGYNILGYSHLGMPIKSYVINPQNYNKTILLTFAMHGFEDSWPQDGKALVEIGTDVLLWFSKNPEALKGARLIVIPCVNPDGTWLGIKSEGFGRCNAVGIDINRDFDYHWTCCKEAKYHTGETPFSTPEAKVLQQIVLTEKPDIVIDFHGWLNCTYGDKELSKYFLQSFGMNIKTDEHVHQSFAGWASQYSKAVLIEYPNPGTYQSMLSQQYSQKTIDFISNICD